MLKKIKLTFVCATFFAIVACEQSSKDWTRGDYGGKSKLSAEAHLGSPAKDIETGTGSFTFISDVHLVMGRDTPLAGCNLQPEFTSEPQSKITLVSTLRAYRGDTKNDLGCLGFVGGKSFRVEIDKGWIERDQNGETVLHIAFSKPGDSYAPLYKYEVRGYKTSWFR